MDGSNGVFCLVVADHLDFALAGHHQGDNLPCRPHKRLAEAHELDLADRVDHLDHSSSLSIEQHPIAAGAIPPFTPTQYGDGLGVNLGEDWLEPRREIWDLDQLPCLCAQPQHLHGGQIAIATPSACDVALIA